MPSSRNRTEVALSIGTVSQLTGLEIHTLRYWEQEFAMFLQPGRTKGGQRRYSPQDIAVVLDIKRLLKEDRYSIEGARRVLEAKAAAVRGDRNERAA